MSPTVFTPYGFGPDFTNHLWLIWHQGLAISNEGHPTVFLQSGRGIFEPFYGFYGGTLYAIAGGLSALAGNHPYPVYIASFGAWAAFAYGGTWWFGRQVGLSRWVAHLPAFIAVTAAYYLTDAYARGAWPEFVALSVVPMFVASGLYLLTRPWRVWAVALFAFATLILTGSHNITLLWSVFVIGPIALLVWIAAGKTRPGLRQVLALVALTVLATAVNAWYLLIDLRFAADTRAWAQNVDFVGNFGVFFFFNNIGNVLDPLRGTPARSEIFGLTIAAPIAAFAFGLAVLGIAWRRVRRGGTVLRVAWGLMLAAEAVLVVMMVMPASWWQWLGTPFTEIQFPYRLAGWLFLLIAAQLIVSLRLARGVDGWRRNAIVGLGAALVALTLVQTFSQLYAGTRVDEETPVSYHTRTEAFLYGESYPPPSYYAQGAYGDHSEPVVKPKPRRRLEVALPKPGQTQITDTVPLPPGSGPIETNIVGGPYVARIEGVKPIGRTRSGAVVIEPNDPDATSVRISVDGDTGATGVVGVVISIAALVGCLLLLVYLALRPPAAVWSAPLFRRTDRTGPAPSPPA